VVPEGLLNPPSIIELEELAKQGGKAGRIMIDFDNPSNSENTEDENDLDKDVKFED